MPYHQRKRSKRRGGAAQWKSGATSWKTWMLRVSLTVLPVFMVGFFFFPHLFQQGFRLFGDIFGGRTSVGVQQKKKNYDGIDVSRYQGKIDWSRVAADASIQFVYIKATEGSTLVDETYHRNMREASARHLNVGSYHYLTSRSSIRAQFNNFTRSMSRHRQILKPVLDIEEDGVRRWSKKQAQDSLQFFVDLMKEKYGVTPIIYTYSNYYNKMLAPKFNKYHLFIAQYNKKPPVIEGVGRHNLWQHSDKGVIDGISQPVDLNVFAEGTTLEDILMPIE